MRKFGESLMQRPLGHEVQVAVRVLLALNAQRRRWLERFDLQRVVRWCVELNLRSGGLLEDRLLEDRPLL